MCRLMLYSIAMNLTLLKLATKSFSLATQFDVVLNDFKRDERPHNHGWGLACVTMKFRELTVMHFKPSPPLLNKDFKSLLKALQKDVL